MKIYLLRHGETAYNAEKRYQGTRDIPLSPKGRAELAKANFSPETVFVSPLCRALETASIVFPQARQVVVQDLREMCFGSFEGRNYVEMEHDPDFLAWVNASCESACPDGERKEEFCARTCAAFDALMEQAFAECRQQLVILAHGGTQMALMERYAQPHRNYYDWCGPNAGGFVLYADEKTWQTGRSLQLAGTVQYLKKADAE